MSVVNATKQVASTDFALAVGAAVVGYFVGEAMTNLMRSRVLDIPVAGGDAIYTVVVAIALMAAPIPNSYARPMALGAVTGGVASEARQIQVLSGVLPN